MPKTWCLAAALVLVAACQSSPPPLDPPASQAFQDELPRSPVLGLEFWVNDVRSPMRSRAENGRDEVESTISTGEFEVRFPTRKSQRALRMIAWTDRTIFALEPGMKFLDVQFLRPGTGMADKSSGRMTLNLSDYKQNYYIETRVQKHSDDQEKVQFARVATRGDLNADSIFVTAVMDFNDNETVDTGEYEYFNLRLPRA